MRDLGLENKSVFRSPSTKPKFVDRPSEAFENFLNNNLPSCYTGKVVVFLSRLCYLSGKNFIGWNANRLSRHYFGELFGEAIQKLHFVR